MFKYYLKTKDLLIKSDQYNKPGNILINAQTKYSRTPTLINANQKELFLMEVLITQDSDFMLSLILR